MLYSLMGPMLWMALALLLFACVLYGSVLFVAWLIFRVKYGPTVAKQMTWDMAKKALIEAGRDSTDRKPNRRPRPDSFDLEHECEEPDFELKYRKRKFLTDAELRFYRVIRETLPEGFTVLSKVRMADIVTPDVRGQDWKKLFNLTSQKHCDFAIARIEDLQPMLLLELDDVSHEENDKRVLRDELVDEIYKSAGIRVIHVKAKSSYNVEKLKNLFSDTLGVKV